jgi:phosphoribosylanthranilate isomerase
MHGETHIRTRIKVCGITNPEDGREAARLGADAIGLVFYARSPRAVDAATASRICAGLPPFVTAVGLFVDPEPEFVTSVLREVPLDLLQFHGDESPEACARHGRPYIKAVRMREGVDLNATAERYRDSRGLLLDAYRPGIPGGTGESFAWERVPRRLDTPIILAGGLNPGNIGEAIRCARPFAVDVSSGVEAAKGRKDHSLMAQFVKEVTDVDRTEEQGA